MMAHYIQFILSQTAEPMAGSGWDMFGALYTLLSGILIGALGYGAKKLIELINAKIHNETLAGVMVRLVGSINDAVSMVNQTLKREIKAAKSPESPGGEKITEAEKTMLFNAVWVALGDEYGGFDGIFGLLKKIGIGNEAAAKAKIDTMIEAAVNSQKKGPA